MANGCMHATDSRGTKEQRLGNSELSHVASLGQSGKIVGSTVLRTDDLGDLVELLYSNRFDDMLRELCENYPSRLKPYQPTTTTTFGSTWKLD